MFCDWKLLAFCTVNWPAVDAVETVEMVPEPSEDDMRASTFERNWRRFSLKESLKTSRTAFSFELVVHSASLVTCTA